MPAKPTPQARVPRSLSVPADLDAAWSAALDASGESRPQWIARHVQEDQAGTVKALVEALEALEAEATIALVMLSKEDTQGKRLYQAAIVKARAALAQARSPQA